MGSNECPSPPLVIIFSTMVGTLTSGQPHVPRQMLDACPAVSVLKLYHAGRILPGTTSVALSIGGGEPVSVAITRHVPPQYTWAPGIPAFSCPTCGRNVRYLYILNGQFGCRHCFRLSYASCYLRRWSPALRRIASLRRKLGADPAPFAPLPPLPDGKGKLRYDRRVAELRACEAQARDGLSATIAALERHVQRKGTRYERQRRQRSRTDRSRRGDL
jgi:hypothetical protein